MSGECLPQQRRADIAGETTGYRAAEQLAEGHCPPPRSGCPSLVIAADAASVWR
jgi:hypothetical protein